LIFGIQVNVKGSGQECPLYTGGLAMTAADFRRIALGMPEAVEGSHFGNADFRVGGKIFATLALEKEGYGVLLLTPEQQDGIVEDEPKIFSPVAGGWGRQGARGFSWRKYQRTY
jgi:YjbR protein